MEWLWVVVPIVVAAGGYAWRRWQHQAWPRLDAPTQLTRDAGRLLRSELRRRGVRCKLRITAPGNQGIDGTAETAIVSVHREDLSRAVEIAAAMALEAPRDARGASGR